MKIIIVALATLLVSGCASNQFAENYKGFVGTSAPSYIPSSTDVQIIEVQDFTKEAQPYLERSYLPIGGSSFVARSGSQNLQSLKEHAKSVGAQIVLFNRSSAGSNQVVLPITTPTRTTSQTQSNYNLYNYNLNNSNSYNSVLYGNSTTTTYGSQTDYVPVTVNFTTYSSAYLAKFHSRTGIYPHELTNEEKVALEQNTGFKVGVIVNESPAYYANILPNDIVTKINGVDIAGVNGFFEITNRAPSGSMKIELIRNQKKLNKTITIQ